MKQRQQAHLTSIRMKCETARGCDDVDRRRGGTGREKGADDVSRADANLTGLKNKKITQSIELLQMDGKDLKQ
jgi:hypothetical protein